VSKVHIAARQTLELDAGEYEYEISVTDVNGESDYYKVNKAITVPDIGAVYLTIEDDVPTSSLSTMDLPITNTLDQRLELHRKIVSLGEMERKILDLQVDRLLHGRTLYGVWGQDDPRDYLQEALEEALDLMQYVSAQLIKLNCG
jgi:hypothetical protein